MNDSKDKPAGPGVVPDPAVVVQEVAALEAECVEVDGHVIQVAVSTWAIYGHSTYDGEIIVGEYASFTEAEAVLRAAPRIEVGRDDSGVRPPDTVA